jgi:hypothetical protein
VGKIPELHVPGQGIIKFIAEKRGRPLESGTGESIIEDKPVGIPEVLVGSKCHTRGAPFLKFLQEKNYKK